MGEPHPAADFIGTINKSHEACYEAMDASRKYLEERFGFLGSVCAGFAENVVADEGLLPLFPETNGEALMFAATASLKSKGRGMGAKKSATPLKATPLKKQQQQDKGGPAPSTKTTTNNDRHATTNQRTEHTTNTKTKTRGQGEKQITDAGLHKHVSHTPAEQHKVAEIAPGKFDYIFGKVNTGSEHNISRSQKNNLAQMNRLGLSDTSEGRQILTEHLNKVVNDQNTVVREFVNSHGVKCEIRESLLAGPSNKFAKIESGWEVLSNGNRRLITIIPKGGQ
jgi:hypothetical protein